MACRAPRGFTPLIDRTERPGSPRRTSLCPPWSSLLSVSPLLSPRERRRPLPAVLGVGDGVDQLGGAERLVEAAGSAEGGGARADLAERLAGNEHRGGAEALAQRAGDRPAVHRARQPDIHQG